MCFNYTDTLEQVYEVSRDRILYIHNKAVDVDSILILGHSRKPKSSKELNYDPGADPRIIEGNKILDDYFIETYKSTESIIAENFDFFSGLNEVDLIYVFGHSFSLVDQPYYKEVFKRVDLDKTKWNVSFHMVHELEKFKKFFRKKTESSREISNLIECTILITLN